MVSTPARHGFYSYLALYTNSLGRWVGTNYRRLQHKETSRLWKSCTLLGYQHCGAVKSKTYLFSLLYFLFDSFVKTSMDKRAVFLCFISVLALVSCQYDEDEGPCFRFPGGGYLDFSPNGYDNDNDVHYRLKFHTNEDNGVILYSRGLTGDYESLYIRDGRLHYILFNTSPTGVEGYFGGYFHSEEVVNTGEWVTVNLYRSWRMSTSRRGRGRFRTGFTVKVGNGNRISYTDNIRREGVSLSSTVSIGGYRTGLSDEVGNFVGEIKDIREMKNGIVFEEPSLNFARIVERSCLGDRDVL